MLSSKTRYALRALIYLSINEKGGERIGIKNIAADLEIPTPYLAKIMQNLARQNILLSTKGPRGGFAMAKPPKKIKIMDIIELTEGKDFFDRCMLGLKSCTEGNVRCPIFKRYDEIRSQLKHLFRNQSIQDLIDELNSSDIKYSI